MIALISLFVVMLIWRFFIIFGATVFEEAGLSQRSAGFEARSALVGAGYTTSESEYVVQNPVARQVAAMLLVTGYIGPTIVVGLLGASFLIPTTESLAGRTIGLIAFIVLLVLLDRLGIIRALGRRPARVAARRMLGASTFETWTVVGDRAVATLVIPDDTGRAEAVTATLNAADVDILAVDPVGRGGATFAADGAPPDVDRGDRVVVFGTLDALEPLRDL